MNLIQSAHPVKTNPIFSRNIGLVSRSDSLLIKTVKNRVGSYFLLAHNLRVNVRNCQILRASAQSSVNPLCIYSTKDKPFWWHTVDNLVIFVSNETHIIHINYHIMLMLKIMRICYWFKFTIGQSPNHFIGNFWAIIASKWDISRHSDHHFIKNS